MVPFHAARRALPLLALLLSSWFPMPGRAAGETDPASYQRVLVVGDSISKHAPSEELGWTGNWGMAASSEDKDYVHLFLAKLAAARGAGSPAPEVWIAAEGGGKVPDKLVFADKITAFHADLALVQMGENDTRDVNGPGFQVPYENLLEAIRAGNPKVRILCAGVWGGSPMKDSMIRAACRKYDATFVDLAAANADPANRAQAENRFTHPGVNWHPGDRGMAAYADAFWQGLTKGGGSTVPAAEPAQRAPLEIVETWSAPPALDWRPAPSTADEQGKQFLKIVSPGPDGIMYMAALDAAKLGGRDVRIQTRIRGEALSEKPKPWNGIRVGLLIVDAEGKKDYPQSILPVGTFDWTDVNWSVRIPDNAVSVSILFGLDHVGGTVWFDAVHISAGD